MKFGNIRATRSTKNLPHGMAFDWGLALHREGLYQFFWFGVIYGVARLVALQIIIYIAFVAFLCLLGCLWLWICLLTAFSNTKSLTLQSLTHFNHQHFFFFNKTILEEKKFKQTKYLISFDVRNFLIIYHNKHLHQFTNNS